MEKLLQNGQRKCVAVANQFQVLNGHLKLKKSILHNCNQTRKKSISKKIDFYDSKQTQNSFRFSSKSILKNL
jgi:hypothetical protein